jgi:hypothetical protein
MARSRRRLIAWAIALALAAPVGSRADEPEPPLACSADAPTVPLGGAVLVRAWATSGSGPSPLRYAWEATAGRVDSASLEGRWDLADVRPGTYAAIVHVTDPDGRSSECVVRVIVRSDPGARAVPPGGSRETAWSLLLQGRSEAEGYGLYSYLLLGSPPSEATRERYLGAVDAYWRLVPDIKSLERYVARHALNVAYLPVTAAPTGPVTPAWLLERHDYARSRSLLRALPGTHRDGPYIVSTLTPIGGRGLSGPYLFQDLSAVPPHLVAAWIREFLNQAAQVRFWEQRAGEKLALRLRLTLGILGAGLPEVRTALDAWIAWAR